MTRHDDDRDGLTGLTSQQERALEDELLARLMSVGGTSTLAAIFDGFRPAWAFDAADRLEAGGLVELLEDKRTAVTDAGRQQHARDLRDADHRRATPADLRRRLAC